MAMQLGCQLSRAHTCKPTVQATVARIGLRKASQVHDARTCKCAACCRVRATGMAGVATHVSAGSRSGSNVKNSSRSRICAAASSSALSETTATPSFASPVEEVEEPVMQTVLIPTLLAGASLVGCAVLVAGMGVCEATCLGSLQWTQLTSSALFCGYYLSYMGQQVDQRLPPSDRSLLAQGVLDNAPAWRPFLQGLAVSHMLHVAILSYATAFFPPAVYAYDAVCSVIVTGLLAGICWTELGHQGRNLQNASFTAVGTMVIKVALLATSAAAVATKVLASSQIPAFAAISTAILLPNVFLPSMLRV